MIDNWLNTALDWDGTCPSGDMSPYGFVVSSIEPIITGPILCYPYVDLASEAEATRDIEAGRVARFDSLDDLLGDLNMEAVT